MATDDQLELLYQIVSAQLTAEDDCDTVTRRVIAVGEHALIDRGIVDRVVERLVSERSAVAAKSAVPRLFVDWGELPRIGSTARPQFSLVCPAYASKPELRIMVDRDLDHENREHWRGLRCEEAGLWTFQVPFRLTTTGMNCRPGQYIVDVQVAFPDADPGQQRFFGTRIRLMVGGASDDEPILEISGEGQSVVNLQGCDLRAFSKVILRASQDGMINLQELFPVARPEAPTPARESATFEYGLKPDFERERRLPRLSQRFVERGYLERAGLFFEDGRRILLLAKRRVTLGRNRENDVVIRFLPRSTSNDEFSRGVSRTHIALELATEGLILVDESSTGTELNSSLVEKTQTLPQSFAGESLRLEFGCSITVKKPFELALEIFGADHDIDAEDTRLWDQIYLKTLGERMPRIWQTALESGINAVQLDRVGNLAAKEGYVILFREVLIGGSRSRCAIPLSTRAQQPVARLLHAGRCFWIERLHAGGMVELNDVELQPLELAPLAVGQRLNLDGVRCRFGGCEQMFLDEPIEESIDRN